MQFSLSRTTYRVYIQINAMQINVWQYMDKLIFFREKFSGIKPPVLRSEIDFDPGSKYHIAANIPYIR
jgi:hypothetical protein